MNNYGFNNENYNSLPTQRALPLANYGIPSVPPPQYNDSINTNILSQPRGTEFQTNKTNQQGQHGQPGQNITYQRHPIQIICQHCNQHILTKIKYEWGAGALCCVIPTFCLSLICFLEHYHICSSCGVEVGRWSTDDKENECDRLAREINLKRIQKIEGERGRYGF